VSESHVVENLSGGGDGPFRNRWNLGLGESAGRGGDSDGGGRVSFS